MSEKNKPVRNEPKEETQEDTSLNRPHGHHGTTDLDPSPEQYGEAATDEAVEQEHNTPHADRYEELAETRNDNKKS